MSPDPLRPGECHVWTARAVSVPAPGLLGLLDAAERERYEGFRPGVPRASYLTAHALLRLVLAEVLGGDPAAFAFGAGPYGKPCLSGAPLEFSLSHAREYVAVAVTGDAPVGVDIEEITALDEPPLVVLSDGERAELARLPVSVRPAAFTAYWVRKEAVLKATGEGLRVHPGTLTVSAPHRPAALLSWGERVQPHPPVRLYDVEAGDGHRAAVAVLGRECRVVRHDGDGVLRRPRRPLG
ncbi:4'-phosphopantetheinyl transferase family protein [Streptomyces sp. NPDC003027]